MPIWYMMASLPSRSSSEGSCFIPVPVLWMPKMRATFSFDSFLKRYSVGTRSTFSRRIARANRSRGLSSLIAVLLRSTRSYILHIRWLRAVRPAVAESHELEAEQGPALPRRGRDVIGRRAAAVADDVGTGGHQPLE